jgi:hypothetical protein
MPSLQWALRRSLWDAITVVKYRGNKPVTVTVPHALDRPIELAPIREVFPEIGIGSVRCAKRVPPDESDALRSRFFRFDLWLMRVFGPNLPGLPEVDPDWNVRLARAYNGAKRKLFPQPILPQEFSGSEPDLAALALAGPYYGYLTRLDENRWEWDFRSLSEFEHLPELHNLGSRVIFERAGGASLRPASIECELGSVTPSDPQWPRARAIALCALTTHCGLVRHFNGAHLTFGFAPAVAARNELPLDHPLLRLLWPHCVGTHSSNANSTFEQLDPAGDSSRTYSFTVGGLYALFDKTYAQLRLSDYDPVEYAQKTGLVAAGIHAPGEANLGAIYAVFEEHANNYLRCYYSSDTEIAADEVVQRWLHAIDTTIPGGLPEWAKQRSISALARFVAVFMYVVIVEHQLRGQTLWNYQPWTHVQPIRVYRDGRREPVDVYQWLVNCNLILNVRRAPLIQDYSHLALDERGAEAFRTFKGRLEALQRELDENPRQPWKLYPDILNANMNA